MTKFCYGSSNLILLWWPDSWIHSSGPKKLANSKNGYDVLVIVNWFLLPYLRLHCIYCIFIWISVKTGSLLVLFFFYCAFTLRGGGRISAPEWCAPLSVATYQIPFLRWPIVFVSTVFLLRNAICICPFSKTPWAGLVCSRRKLGHKRVISKCVHISTQDHTFLLLTIKSHKYKVTVCIQTHRQIRTQSQRHTQP